ncbi:MAG: hypothetical protein JXB88_04600 [Spirochaetales bacterium]|nr:hypothetical protein [Spirochaetales bacterium]
MKEKIICIFIAFFLLYPVFSREGSELTSGIYGNDEFRFRLSVFNEYITLLLITKATGYENYDVIAGFSTPWILFGPVSRYGLFKEIYSPLAYTPGSAVFKEKSDIRLSCAFEPGKRRFLECSPYPGICGFFLQTGEGIPFLAGGQIAVAVKDIFFQDMLVLFSVPVAGDEDAWYTASHQFPGGKVYHLCAKSLFKIPAFCFSITGIISGGDIIIPGFFLNCSVSNQMDWYALSVVFGYCSAYYITPDGSYKNRMIRTGGSLDLSPFPLLDFHLCSYFDVDHPSSIPQEYLCTTSTIKGKVKLNHRIQKEILMEFALSDDSSISFNEQGRRTEEHEISLSAGLYRDIFTGETALSFPFIQEKEIIPEWKLDLAFHMGTHSLKINNTFFTGNNLSWKGSLDYGTNINQSEVRLLFSLKKPLTFTGPEFRVFKNNPFEFILITLSFVQQVEPRL